MDLFILLKTCALCKAEDSTGTIELTGLTILNPSDESLKSFPINSHGIMFAIVELTSSLINFSQIPITDAVKLNQDFDLLTYLLIWLSLIIVLRIVFELKLITETHIRSWSIEICGSLKTMKVHFLYLLLVFQ